MRKVALIYGPPCSGKTTQARTLARPGDLIIDWDLLAQEAGSPRDHDHEQRFAVAASRERMRLEDYVTHMTNGTAYIIRTLGDPDEREQAAARIGATELIRCDPGGAECIRRAHDLGRRPTTDELIIRWYAQDWGSRALTHRRTGGAAQRTAHPGLA
ncbi:AAA family ATPase [Leucobacter sp. NPDC058333]|uniref:AAA family ATPase n=1 Tax=Leucobacter sp. NPDC058333 TaxID=3346450 RepID=UPI00364D89B1